MISNVSPFNSSLEVGIRALTLLEAAYPKSLDVQRLVEFDYLVLHSKDANGPESLHAPLPLRTGELLVRRKIIEAGLVLMMSRNLALQITSIEGIKYLASEATSPFLNSLTTKYINKLKERAKWVEEQFGNKTDEELRDLIRHFFDKWTIQFQPIVQPTGSSQ